MGRTIHYEIINAESLTNDERNFIMVVNESAITVVPESFWTAQNFFLDSFGISPNFSNRIFKNKSHKEIQEILAELEERYDKLHLDFDKTIELLIKEGVYVQYRDRNVINGSSEIFGNEKNADFIFQVLLRISVGTSAEIRIVDEGRYLYAPILMKGGKVKIDKELFDIGVKEARDLGYLDNNELGAHDDFVAGTQLLEMYDGYSENVDDFHRKVIWADFDNYNPTLRGQTMSGYAGEYWEIKKSAEDEKDRINGVIFNEQNDSSQS